MDCAIKVTKRGWSMDVRSQVLGIIDEALCLGGAARQFVDESPLLGAVHELDSMAVIAVIALMEQRFGFAIDDDEIDGACFATVGTLVRFVNGKLGLPVAA
jgi:acyl carrier protein